MTKTSGIYIIVNIKNGKVYIGQTIDIQRRWKHHKTALEKSKHTNQYLQASWNKYGAKAFKFQILEYCAVEQLDEREQHYLDIYMKKGACYNISKYAKSPGRGLIRSDETRQKMSASLKGRIHSEETRKKISRTLTGRPGIKGVTHTIESKRKMSAAKKGKKVSEEHRKKIVEGLKGRIVSEETRRKIGNSNRGKIRTEETKTKLSEARRKRPPPSEETKRKISESLKGRILPPVSEETKQKLSIAARLQWLRKKSKQDE